MAASSPTRPMCAGPPMARKCGPSTTAGSGCSRPSSIGTSSASATTSANAATASPPTGPSPKRSRTSQARAPSAPPAASNCATIAAVNTSPDYFQGQSRFHGFTPSFAFVGEPETNGVAERFDRMLKEQIIHGHTYRNRAELAAAVSAFVITYNREWRLEKLRYKNPLDARRDYQPASLSAA